MRFYLVRRRSSRDVIFEVCHGCLCDVAQRRLGKERLVRGDPCEEPLVVTLGAEDRDSHDIDALDAVSKPWTCQRRRVWFPTGAHMSFLDVNAFSIDRSRGGLTGSQS